MTRLQGGRLLLKSREVRFRDIATSSDACERFWSDDGLSGTYSYTDHNFHTAEQLGDTQLGRQLRGKSILQAVA